MASPLAATAASKVPGETPQSCGCLPDALDVFRVVNPQQGTDRVLVRGERAFAIHHPPPLGSRGQCVEDNLKALRRLRMTEPRPVFQAPRMRPHAQRHVDVLFNHPAMIANRKNRREE